MQTLMSDESTSYMHYLNFVIECLYIFSATVGYYHKLLLVATCWQHEKLALRQILVATLTCFVALGCGDETLHIVAITYHHKNSVH
uniref:Uncharacterized protein n=2 Tax=Aegilops tauschii subsp. strangulata TaxID=200361 RepID=A0A453K693_AEGTS